MGTFEVGLSLCFHYNMARYWCSRLLLTHEDNVVLHPLDYITYCLWLDQSNYLYLDCQPTLGS